MTTIAFDGRFLASDSAKFGGERLKINTSTQKLFVREGLVFAMVGCFALQDPWIEWYLSGHDPMKKPWTASSHADGIGLWVYDKGTLWQFESELPYPIEVLAPFAMGSGADFAMGAFRLASVINRPISAQEAVRAAIACDPFSDGEVQSIDLLAFQEAA